MIESKKCKPNEVIVTEIFYELEIQERNLLWLAKKAEINYQTLYSIMRQKTTRLSPDKLESINKALGTSFCIEFLKK